MTRTVRMCEREGEKESRLIWCKKAGVGERERERMEFMLLRCPRAIQRVLTGYL